MDAATTIGEARRRAGLGLRELARRARTSHATLHAYEHGAKQPRVDTLDDVVRAAGFAIDAKLSLRVRTNERGVPRGEELAEVLTLAEAFPARHRRRLSMPPFRRVAP